MLQHDRSIITISKHIGQGPRPGTASGCFGSVAFRIGEPIDRRPTSERPERAERVWRRHGERGSPHERVANRRLRPERERSGLDPELLTRTRHLVCGEDRPTSPNPTAGSPNRSAGGLLLRVPRTRRGLHSGAPDPLRTGGVRGSVGTQMRCR